MDEAGPQHPTSTVEKNRSQLPKGKRDGKERKMAKLLEFLSRHKRRLQVHKGSGIQKGTTQETYQLYGLQNTEERLFTYNLQKCGGKKDYIFLLFLTNCLNLYPNSI